ncbi:helix-turn-helix domain-containing protein [Micromonospora sp. NPDC050397]|uniref:helix-turn-helix domain-containing protein n=1 Tax=Micromonospora sp. NPDC050397 TaxID=3364279 RepID=UPI00384AE779
MQRLRLVAGMSLGELSRRIYYSKGHLSKVENGRRGPSPELARACDALLDGGGALVRLATPPEQNAATALAEIGLGTGAWRLELRPDGSGTVQIGEQSLPLPTAGDRTADMESVFDAVRRWGRVASPAAVLPVLIAQLHVVRAAAAGTTGPVRVRHMALAARMSEFAGWMAQEAGDSPAALWWTDLAARLAEEAGMAQMSDHVLIRRALVTMYDRQPAQTIALAERARSRPGASPRIRWLAALREAQGYALAGDQSGCLAALDRARELAALVPPAVDTRLGPETPMDLHAVTTAWCLYDLGHFAASATLFDQEVPRIPTESTRSYARFATRRVLAHASAGNVDRVCELLPEVLDQAERADSATVRAELRALARTTLRWAGHADIQRLRPRLTAELARSPGGYAAASAGTGR